jgi:hypothetical protein
VVDLVLCQSARGVAEIRFVARHRQRASPSTAATTARDIACPRRFFAAHRASEKPLWITEFGYPSDPAYQYDRAYHAGPASQAAYLCHAIPILLAHGAAKVFVTLRDNLGGPFASEGVITGGVSDPPAADPLVVRKPAFAALSRLGVLHDWAPIRPLASLAGSAAYRSR